MVEVTRPSSDCQTTFSRRFKQFGEILKKVAERSRCSGRRSRDRRSTVIQRFFDVSSNYKIFWKKSLNGHATVVEVTRPSADCQTTFFVRFKWFWKILKKVAERSRDSGWGHATVGRLSNNVFWTFQAIRKKFEKSRWTVTRQWSEVTRTSTDCQTTTFRRIKQLEIFLKKVAERSRDSGRRSRNRRPTVKQRFFDVLSNLGKFWKKSLNGHATMVGGHATVGRLSYNDFSTFQAIRKFLKKVAERSRDSGWSHATVGRLWNNVFSTFQAIWENFKKCLWTVTRQLSEVTRTLVDGHSTIFRRFKRFENFLKKVAERSRDSGRRSRDRRLTVKQRFFDVSSK